MNTFGQIFRISIFGESHGNGVGAVIDGIPAGISLNEKDFEHDILRRKSGARGTTPRKEDDMPMIMSGVLGGYATGAPLATFFRQADSPSCRCRDSGKESAFRKHFRYGGSAGCPFRRTV